jgi:hypothetical protein
MTLRVGRRVSSSDASLKAHGKKVKQANMMQPGIAEPAKLGDADPTDHSNGNDGSKAAVATPSNDHVGPDRTK